MDEIGQVRKCCWTDNSAGKRQSFEADAGNHHKPVQRYELWCDTFLFLTDQKVRQAVAFWIILKGLIKHCGTLLAGKHNCKGEDD